MRKDEIMEVNKISVVISTTFFFIVWAGLGFILAQYIKALDKTNEPVYILIGLLGFCYFVIPRGFSIMKDCINGIKYNRRYK